MKIITLTSDFGVQSQGIGIMEATIFSIAPHTKIIHLMHGLCSFDLIAAARTMETIQFIPVGYHICVCDPGVGTSRKALIIKVKRGDYLIGPDNGILISASTLLGGIIRVHEIQNKMYMRLPISPIFHGRDIFSPAAAHLANGVSIENFGPELDPQSLVGSPYEEAIIYNKVITAKVIQINKFGSLHLNILNKIWDKLGIKFGDIVKLDLPNNTGLNVHVCNKFGDVKKGDFLILKDDYGRIEIAVNQGSFAELFSVNIGSSIVLTI